MEPWGGAPRAPRRWQAEALPAVLAAIRRSRPEAPVRPLVSAVMGAGKSILLSELAWLALHGRAHEEDVVIIAAPRQGLVEQLAGTVRERCGREAVGVYYQHDKQPARPVVVCCYSSLPGLVEQIVALGRRVCLFIGDEAHRTECGTVLAAWEQLAPIAAVGVTATPYRADDRESLSLWTEVAYRYPIEEAWRDGVLVPYRHLRVHEAWVRSGEVPVEGVEALDLACLRLLREAVDKRLDVFPCISSAYDIPDAEGFVDALRAAGYTADAVHSRRGRDDNARAIRKLRDGAIQVLVQVNMLSEGADFPWLRGLLLRRNIQSPVMAFQLLGRGLRACEGKTECVVMDPHRNLETHGVSRPEQLGARMEEEAAAGHYETDDEEEAERERKAREVRISFVGDVETWASEVLGIMAEHGLYQVTDRWARRDDDEDALLRRAWGPSEKQIATLRKMGWTCRYLPQSVRAEVKALVAVAGELERGAVSDLLSILFALARCTEDVRKRAREVAEATGSWAAAPRWTWPAAVVLPPCPAPPGRIVAEARYGERIDEAERHLRAAPDEEARKAADKALRRLQRQAEKVAAATP